MMGQIGRDRRLTGRVGRVEEAHDEDGQQQRGEGQHDVHGVLGDAVDRPPPVAGDQAEEAADEQAERDRERRRSTSETRAPKMARLKMS